MKTEYILSDAQKAEIMAIQQEIFNLQMKISAIYASAGVRYVSETDAEKEQMLKYFGMGIRPMQGIVKMNTKGGVDHE